MTTYVTPKPGDIFLCYDPWILRGPIDAVERIGLLRRGIKPPLGRPIYSHVAVYLGSGEVAEAISNGLVKSPSAKYRGYADVWSKPIGSERRSKVVSKANAMVAKGYTYSWWDDFIQFVRLLTGLKIPWHQTHSIICSVFGYDCWDAAGEAIAALRNCCPEDIAVFGALEFTGRY